MSGPVNVADYAALAAGKVDPKVWCYFEGGAGDEVSLRANAAAYGRWRFRPRMLVDVEGASAATTVLGTPVSMPLLVAPFAMQRLLDPEGEVATARAAAAAGTLLCVSTITSSTHARDRGGGGRRAALAPALRPPRPAGARSTISPRRASAATPPSCSRSTCPSSDGASATCGSASRFRPTCRCRTSAAAIRRTPRRWRSTSRRAPSLTWDDLEWIAAESGAAARAEGDPHARGCRPRRRARRGGGVRLQPRRPPARRRRGRARRAARGGRGGRRPLRGLRRRRHPPRRATC